MNKLMQQRSEQAAHQSIIVGDQTLATARANNIWACIVCEVEGFSPKRGTEDDEVCAGRVGGCGGMSGGEKGVVDAELAVEESADDVGGLAIGADDGWVGEDVGRFARVPYYVTA